MMDATLDPAARILDIEARQDEALRQLELLERQLDQILAEYSRLAPVPPTSPQPVVDQPAA